MGKVDEVDKVDAAMVSPPTVLVPKHKFIITTS